MAGSVTYRVSSNQFDANVKTVGEEFFGGNYLFDRDKTGAQGTFDEKVQALDIDFLRYPGGAIAEESFLLTAPNRNADPAMGGKALTPLSEFISYADSINATYSIVAPTKNYMDALDSGEMNIWQIRMEVRQFAERLAKGEFGDNPPKIIELGNEYFTIEGYSNAREAQLYAEVARAMAIEFRAALGRDVEIGVQAGINEKANDIILAEFANLDGLVDTVIFHSYPWTIDAVWQYQHNKADLFDKWLKAGVAESVFASEFNISDQLHRANGQELDARHIEAGMAKAVALVELTATMIDEGVDYGAVWPLQQRTNSDLGGNEGELGGETGKLTGNNLTLSGEAFRLMSESVVDKKLVNSSKRDIDGAREAARYQKEVFFRTYEGEDETVIFISAWDLNERQIGFNIDLDIPGRFHSAEITRLYAEGDDLDPNARPVLEQTKIGHINSIDDIDVKLLHNYEVVRITLEKVEKYATGGAQDDRMKGTEADDRLFGFAGDDTLIGAAGGDTLGGAGDDDLIYGQQGADRLLGQGGDDKIGGGAGNDVVLGGWGSDRIVGGQGADRLLGQAGRDAIFGGVGADSLNGGAGDDLLRGQAGGDQIIGGRGADIIVGNLGDDKLFGGAGQDRLIGGRDEDTLNGGAGADRMIGGAGDDLFISRHGDDRMNGGAGVDQFQFNANASARVVRIDDFSGDRLAIEGADLDINDVTIENRGDDAFVFFGDTTVVLNDAANSFDAGDIILGSRKEIAEQADAELIEGVELNIELGHRFGDARAEDGVASVAFENTGDDAVLEFTSFDIDVNQEVEVFLNGQSLGHLDKTGNNKLGFNAITIDADDQVAGENIIRFEENLAAVNTWGVGDFLLS